MLRKYSLIGTNQQIQHVEYVSFTGSLAFLDTTLSVTSE